MSEVLQQLAEPPESTDVRFSTRTLLLATIPVALIAAVVGPYFRAFPPDERIRVAAAWIAWLMTVAVWIGFVAARRIRVEKIAGWTIMRLPIYGMHYGWRRVNLSILCAALILFGTFSLYEIAEQAAAAQSVVRALSTAINWMRSFLPQLWRIAWRYGGGAATFD